MIETKAKFTPGSLRAARLINSEQSLAKLESGLYPSDAALAVIIDNETALPDLLASCQAALQLLDDIIVPEPHEQIVIDGLRVAIAKAEKGA